MEQELQQLCHETSKMKKSILGHLDQDTHEFMKKVIDAGIDFIRISVIGYNKDLYKKWMNVDNFDLIFYLIFKKSKNILNFYWKNK